MNVSKLPPKEWLDELFEYRPEEGLFWKLRPTDHFEFEVDWYIWNKRFALKQAGKIGPMRNRGGIVKRDHCRVQMPLCKRGRFTSFSVHRIAFALMEVEVPHGMVIDHWDENPWNNRWSNLRIATPKQNSQNSSGWRRRKHDLPKGVYLDPGKKNPYYAMLKVGEKYERVNSHPTPELAEQAYLKRAKEVHQEFMASGRERDNSLPTP